MCAYAGVWYSYRVLNKEADGTDGQINEVPDLEVVRSDIVNMHMNMLIDEGSNQRVLPASLFPV